MLHNYAAWYAARDINLKFHFASTCIDDIWQVRQHIWHQGLIS